MAQDLRQVRQERQDRNDTAGREDHRARRRARRSASSAYSPTSSLFGGRATLGLVIIAVVLAVSGLIVVQNFQTLQLQILRADIEVRLGWALFLALLSGVGLGVLLARLFRQR